MTTRINDLPNEDSPVASEKVAIDGATTRGTTIQKLVDSGAPVASQAEAEAGANNVKRMTPLRAKQYVDAQVGVSIASAAQGALADTAVQPGDLGDSATLDVGTTAGTVAAGDDERIVNALQAFDTRDSAAEKDLSALSVVRINRFTSSSLVSPATYKEVEQPGNTEPAHDLKFQDSSGKWWEFSHRSVSVIAAGALGNRVADDTAAIQRALEFLKVTQANWNTVYPPRGGVVIFPPGSYRITSPLTLYSYATLSGAGELATEIFLGDGADCDMLVTNGYEDFVGSGLGFLDTSDVPYMVGVRDLSLNGNRFNNSDGVGIKHYGRRPMLKNVSIINMAGDGVVANWSSENDTWVSNKVKVSEGVIENRKIHYCNGNGLIWNGGSDVDMKGVFIGGCRGQFGADIQAPVYIEHMHVYDCGAVDGSNNPIGVRIGANARFETLISESNYGPGVLGAAWLIRIDDLQLYGNCRSYGTFNADFQNACRYVQVDNAEVSLKAVAGAGGITVDSQFSHFGNVVILGDSYATVSYTGTGFRGNSGAKGLSVDSLIVSNMRGTGAVGLLINNGGSIAACSINAYIHGCSTGLNPGPGFGAGSKITLTIEKVSSGQAYIWSPGTVPRLGYGTQQITLVDENGIASAHRSSVRNWQYDQWGTVAAGATLALGTFTAVNCSPSSSTDVTDLTSTFASGENFPRVLIRNSSASNSLVFKNNSSKLRTKGGADTTVPPLGVIEFVWVSGTIWNEV